MALLFPKQNYNVLPPSSYTHISIYFQDRSACSAAGKYVLWTDPGNILIAHRHVNVKIAAQFPEKEYINGIFVAVYINISRVFYITTFCVLYLSPKCREIF
jgi:hypothetical protein